MNEAVKIGNERPLEKSDFLPLSKENKTRSVTDKIQKNWDEERGTYGSPFPVISYTIFDPVVFY